MRGLFADSLIANSLTLSRPSPGHGVAISHSHNPQAGDDKPSLWRKDGTESESRGRILRLKPPATIR
jgi:hypothetical protein